MQTGTITWNSTNLSCLGKPKLTISRQADPPAPAMPTRMLVDLTVTVELETMDPGTLQARAARLLSGMNVTEGLLESDAGSGHSLAWLAVPGENSLAQAMTGTVNAVVLKFSAVETLDSLDSLSAASFIPAGEETTIHLHAIRDLKEEVHTARHTERASARSLTTTTLSFTARVAQADASLTMAERLTALNEASDGIDKLDTREGTLTIPGKSVIVRVTEFRPVIDERAGVLDVTVQCYFITLPDNNTAECMLDTESSIDEGTGEEVISMKGEISASTRTIALAKLSALRATQLETAGQRVIGWKAQQKAIDGKDATAGTAADWTGTLIFSMEIRKTRDGAHKTLRVTTLKDMHAGWKWTYAGTVKATTQAAALAAARAIVADVTHPLLRQSQETVDTVSDIMDTNPEEPLPMRFIKVDFSYEFEGPPTGFIGGEITTETSSPLTGEWRKTCSGNLVAATKALALARLVSLLPEGLVPIDSSDRWTETIQDVGDVQKQVFMRLDFSRSYRIPRTKAALEYTDSTQVSIAGMRQTRTLSGVFWTNNAANSDACFTALMTTIFGENGPHEHSKGKATVQYAADGTVNTLGDGGSQWIKMDFTASKVTKLTGATGYDLLEATMTMERIGSINNKVITPIPFGVPVVQVDTGKLPGRITIKAQAKAINLATAKTWVQGRRDLVSAIGTDGDTRHETDAPRESATPEYLPLGVDTPLMWNFSADYGWTITGTALDGLWNTELAT